MNGNYMNKLDSTKSTVAITAPQQWMNNKNNGWLLMDKETYLSQAAEVVNKEEWLFMHKAPNIYTYI